MVVHESLDAGIAILSSPVFIFVLLFLIGYGTLALSRRYSLPEPLILFGLGMVAHVFAPGVHIEWIVIGVLALLMFDAGAHFLPRKFKGHSILVLEFILYSFVLNTLLSGVLLYAFLLKSFSTQLVVLAIILGSMITACSQFEILKVFKVNKNRLYRLSQLEDHLSNPIMLIIAIIALWFAKSITLNGSVAIMSVLSSLFIDIAVGVFFALIVLGLTQKLFTRLPLVYLSAPIALLTYYQAALFGGTGFIAVLVTSLFFHNSISKIPDMGEFGPFLSNMVYVFVFISLGYVVVITLASLFFAVVLFMLYLAIRFILLHYFLEADQHFLTLDCPKGLAVGALVLVVILGQISSFPGIPSLNVALSSLILVFVMSIAVSYSANVITHRIIKS